MLGQQIQTGAGLQIKRSAMIVLVLSLLSASVFAGNMESQRVSTVINIEEISRVPASIGPGGSLATPSKIFFGQSGDPLPPDLIAIYHSVKEQEAAAEHFQTADIIPLSLQPTENMSDVMKKIADRSTGTLLNSKSFRESSVGQTTTKVENTMKKEVVIHSDEPTAVQHKINFNYQAFQSEARVQYTGFANASMIYKVSEESLGLEVAEPVGHQDLVVSHKVSPQDKFSQVSLRWSF